MKGLFSFLHFILGGSSKSVLKVNPTPTDGGNDGTTEEEGRGHVPAAGEVGREAAHIQAALHC